MVRSLGTRCARIAAAVLAAAAIGSSSVAGQTGSTPKPAIVRVSAGVETIDDAALERIEQAALAGINAERSAAGLPPLACTPELCRIARSYSRAMVDGHFFAHADPDGNTVETRADGAGIKWRSVGENIARNRGFRDPAAVAVREWMKSEGHRENILDARFLETGMGVWVAPDKTFYFTQIFVTRSRR